MIIILLTLLVIFFIPLPLKTSIYYCDENYYIKLYKFEIISKNKSLKKKGDSIKSKKNKTLVKKSIFKDKTLLIKLAKTISNNKFKPILKIRGTIKYSLSNHELTAITYGILSTIKPFIFKAIGILFQVKRFTLPISPIFKESFYMKLEIKGIVFISIGQIIYILFLILKTILIERVKRDE